MKKKKRSAENEGDGFDITRLFQQKVGLDEMIIFSRQMYSLLKAGIPIIRAIKGLSENASHKRFQEILKDIADQLEQGRSLSSSMAKYEKVFTRLTISVVVVTALFFCFFQNLVFFAQNLNILVFAHQNLNIFSLFFFKT